MRIFTQDSNFNFRRISKTLAAVLGLLLVTVTLNAQTEMLWTGGANGTSTNFLIEENWDPAGSPIGNMLNIPMPDTTAATGNPDAQPYAVEVTGADDVSVYSLDIVAATEDAYQSQLIINLDNDETSFTITKGGNDGGKYHLDYHWTGVVVKRGKYIYKRTNVPRLDQMNCKLVIEGGVAEFNNLLMGDNDIPTMGGKIFISGGKLILHGGFGREYAGREDGQVEITADGIVEVAGNYTPLTENWINGGTEYSIKRVYDAVTDFTTFSAVPATYLGIENSSRQQLKVGEEADTLRLIETTAVVDASTFKWQYRADGSTDYVDFTGSTYVDSAKYAPVFNEAGTFFVSCLVDGNRTENEVEFSVVADAVKFLPKEFEIQILKVGQVGTTMTAEFNETPTSFEWKYSTTPGGPYVSFEPAATDASFQPTFNEEGNHYVVIELLLNGETITSSELYYSVDNATKGVTWTGFASTDASDPANWDPIAHYNRNNVTVPFIAYDSVNNVAPNYPVFYMTGNDTINNLTVNTGATMDIISGTDGVVDTFNFRSNVYVNGTLNAQDVYIDYTSYFWRLPEGTSRMNMSGESTLAILADYNGGPSFLLMGDKVGTKGGYIDMKDDAQILLGDFFRMVTTKNDSSVFALADNAQIVYPGDGRSLIKTYVDSTKIRCSVDGYEPIALFDGEDTYIRARNTNAFSIADDSRTYTTAGNEIAEAITLTNVDGVTSWEWKYSTNVFGPWESFAPAQVDEPQFKPNFAALGDYYVVAETSDGIVTSNMKLVTVIELNVTPSAYQQLDTYTEGDTLKLNIELSDDLTLLSGEWFLFDHTLGTDETTGVTDSVYVPEFYFDGKYEIYFLAVIQDADGNVILGADGKPYEFLSNVVRFYVNVDPESAEQLLNGSFELYPNPAKEAFYVNEASNSYEVSVIDAQGRVVLKKQFNEVFGAQRINFNNSGMYVVKVKTSNQVKTQRLIIE